jgi:hypothetical protein
MVFVESFVSFGSELNEIKIVKDQASARTAICVDSVWIKQAEYISREESKQRYGLVPLKETRK